MAVNYTIQVDDKEVNAALKNLLDVLENAEPVMKSIAVEMQADVIDHFNKETGPDGPWLRSKRAIKQHGKTLRDTSALINSLQASGSRIATKEAAILQVSPMTASVKSPLIYGPVHNFGLTIPNRNGFTTMPKREFMWLSKNAIAAIVARLKDAVTKAWNK